MQQPTLLLIHQLRPFQHPPVDKTDSQLYLNGVGNFSKLKCYMFNVRSILNKLCDFTLFMDRNDPDVVILTETWSNNSIPSSLFADCQVYPVAW